MITCGKVNSTCDVSSQIISKKNQTVQDVSNLDISLDDVNWDEPFEVEDGNSISEDLLRDIENVNWDEDDFSENINSFNSALSREDHSLEFKGQYHFSNKMLEALHIKFGLENFRPGQREIINAILNGHDCFVLMPTGGGKSLCYQLPAVLSEGVTIVISPLIALICDQVDKLNALDIRAAHLCCTLSREATKEVISKLYLSEPEIDLLYLTPEKIIGNYEVRKVLESLYQRGKLSRFVLDEVHCLSLWGHDFRPHYKQLCVLRQKYEDIQIICFTATATKQVETDVIINLKLRDVKRFIRSFNRPNIKYRVIDKHEKMPISEIAQLIGLKFFKKSGIIYCLTRKDCVVLSRYLYLMGISAKPYHAGLDDKVREETQREWMQDKFHVIVATIAFGMGIDKPDVRFVIHNTIPKSLEAYYQESGRAGRDGEISYSYLFYNYDDVLRTMRLMDQDFAKKHTLEGHLDNLEQMVTFANNQVDCRRYLQLLNLGETFDRQLCIQNRETICDNCENFNNTVQNLVDITKQAKELATLVRDITRNKNITINMVTKIYRGSRESFIVRNGFKNHMYYGTGRFMTRLDVHRILRDLIIRNILANHYITTGQFPIVYIKPGPELETFLNSTDIKMSIPMANIRSIQPESFQADRLPDMMRTALSTSALALHYLINKMKSQCRDSLTTLCSNIAKEKNVSPSSILHPIAIKCIAEMLPRDQKELLKIQHITVAVFNKLGKEILKVSEYFRKQVESLPGSGQLLISNSSRNYYAPIKRTYAEAFSLCHICSSE